MRPFASFRLSQSFDLQAAECPPAMASTIPSILPPNSHELSDKMQNGTAIGGRHCGLWSFSLQRLVLRFMRHIFITFTSPGYRCWRPCNPRKEGLSADLASSTYSTPTLSTRSSLLPSTSFTPFFLYIPSPYLSYIDKGSVPSVLLQEEQVASNLLLTAFIS